MDVDPQLAGPAHGPLQQGQTFLDAPDPHEGEAQERLVKDVKNAQAMEEVAKHEAKKQLILAEAALEAADKQAKAQIREAEGQ